jgi:hypothetical protein
MSGTAIDDQLSEMDGAMITPSTEFTKTELQAMHRYCLKYRDLVRSDGTTRQDQDEKFILFSRVCYAEGIAYA